MELNNESGIMTQKTNPIFICFLLLIFFYSSSSFALSSRYNNLYQRLGGGLLQPVKNQIFERDTYDTFGAGFSILGRYDLDGNYSIPVGATWTWQVYQIADRQGNAVNSLLTEAFVRYEGKVGSCETLWSTGQCIESAGWTLNVNAPCLKEGLYNLKILYNGTVIGENDFYPTPFKSVVTFNAPDSTTPILKGDNFASKFMPTIDGETFLVYAKVEGKVGSSQCITRLSNATVRLTNTIKTGSAGHEHFSSNNEPGTGSYIALTNAEVINPDSADTNGTVIEGKTSENGYFFAGFSTGYFGVIENMQLDVKREASPLYPEDIVVPLIHELQIKAPNLIEMSKGTADGQFFFSFGGSCKHNPTARWVVPEMKSRLTKLDNAYEAKFGHRISFNDASTQFGGVFDNGGNAGRDSLCHKSHRRGNDIDLNRVDENKQWMELFGYTENGLWKPRLHFVNTRASFFGLTRVNEKYSIHYRFINY